jgi:23S rRNA pseudouridine1911/1915/1917 synthase
LLSETTFSFDVEDAPTDQRLDKFLVKTIQSISRSRIQSLIKDSLVSVNGLPVTKTGYSLSSGDHVEVHIPAAKPSPLKPEEIALDILFENDDVIVINKPAGMVVHPSAGHAQSTLVHAVLAHAPEIEGVGGVRRPGIVHRLDKDTSGIILIAKNDRAHRYLQDQFRLRKVKKVYLALVDGRPPTPRGRIEAPIGRDPINRKKMAVLPAGKGRNSVTEYFTMKNYSHHTLLEVHLFTGRTHQIRLHMAFIHCPVVGDTIYGFRKPSLPIQRNFLHAACLSIKLPGEEVEREFRAELPFELQSILDHLQ